MTLKASTGLRNKLLVTGSMRDILSLGFIHIYAADSVPATADASIGAATLLCTISESGTGTGLTLAATATDGVLSKTEAEVWSGTNVAGGTAKFYRHVAVDDTGVASTTQARLQGEIKTSGAEMNMTAGTALLNGAPTLLNAYFASLPTL